MRIPLLLCLALAACSSDPAAPLDSGPPSDIATEIAAWIDSGTPTDAGDDRAALPDFGPRDTGADVGADAPAADVVDATVGDVGADVGSMDASACGPCVRPNAETQCLAGAPARCVIARCLSPYADCDGDAANGCETNTAADMIHCGGCGQMCTGARSCRSGQCLAPDASVDPRMNCSDLTVRCTSNEECQAMCLPTMSDRPWCCALNHECMPYALGSSCPRL